MSPWTEASYPENARIINLFLNIDMDVERRTLEVWHPRLSLLKCILEEYERLQILLEASYGRTGRYVMCHNVLCFLDGTQEAREVAVHLLVLLEAGRYVL